jgi:hypothetical protein
MYAPAWSRTTFMKNDLQKFSTLERKLISQTLPTIPRQGLEEQMAICFALNDFNEAQLSADSDSATLLNVANKLAGVLQRISFLQWDILVVAVVY